MNAARFGDALSGVLGGYGPNDYGYACLAGRDAAKRISRAVGLLRYGYGHKDDPLSSHHPLKRALGELKAFDEEVCSFANLTHDPSLFI